MTDSKKKELLNILNNYIEKPLYKKEQEEFKKIFFATIFGLHENEDINVERRGIRCINAFLIEDKLPFMITKVVKNSVSESFHWVIYSI